MLWPENALPVDQLKLHVPEVVWDRLQGSGVHVLPGVVDRLEAVWLDHLESLGLEGQWLADEVPRSGGLPEGAVTTVLVNRYERSPAAREACIAHWGTQCVVCSFDFGTTYPRIGNGFIHVHHLRELSTVGDEYEVDPVEDMRPVCPNCHAMLHQRRPAFTIEEMQGVLVARVDRRSSC
jgi:5-methylcytosine-specific restriction protein A